MPLLSVSDQLLGVKDISIIRNVPSVYIFVYDEDHEKYSPLKKKESKRSDAQLQNEVYRRWDQSDPRDVMDL